MKSYIGLVSVAALLVGCATPPDVKVLQDENAKLQAQLQQVNTENDQLKNESRNLNANIGELNRVQEILTTEKNVRSADSSTLRLQVRRFVQQQIDQLKNFMVQGNLLDYIGSELIERSQQDSQSAVIVDFANPILRKGSLSGVTGLFAESTSVEVNVLRPVKDRYLVIWQSQLMTIDQPGIARLQFPVSVGVEKGDIVAYFFPEGAKVSFDSGTGNSGVSNRSFTLGNIVDRENLAYIKEKRSYSLGVFALLED